ncbi:unnamed protein product [Soboliphyme baturini]|uniref:G-patch domain-containing protein n=1 Tax=Soboliphyme baturini TaxID=241478 RepID=A0A183J0G8_9BILA|nr:unnamed protein product [Soboliphyme baturini]
MGEEYESFEISDYDIDSAFNPLRRKRISKNEQIYGIWADPETSGSEEEAGVIDFGGEGKTKKHYQTPLSFVKGGVKKGDQVEEATTKATDDSEVEDVEAEVQAKYLRSKFKRVSTRREFVKVNRGVGEGGERFGDWERHTKGIGAKLLSKMGYVAGKGLGKKAQGIAEPIQAVPRPGRGAIGAYGPETPQQKKDRADGIAKTTSQSEVTAGEEEKQWKKRPGHLKPKYVFRTLDDVVKSMATTTKSRISADHATTKVIDMTGKQQRVYTGYEAFKTRTKMPIEMLEPMTSRQDFDIPELVFNLELLVKLAEDAIIVNERQLRTVQDQMVTLEHEEKIRMDSFQEAEAATSNLSSFLDELNRFKTCQENGSLTLEDCLELLCKLRKNYYEEYKLYDLPRAIICPVLQLMHARFSEWNPLDNPDSDVELMREWRGILDESGEWNHSTKIEDMNLYHRIIWECWMPVFRRAALKWDPRNPDIMVMLIDKWKEALPLWILENILEQVILPRLQNEVDNWNPLKDTIPIHQWIHPWLPLMGDRLQPLYSPIRLKLGRALSHWHPSDGSAKMILRPWKDVFSASSFDTFVTQHIVPKLERCLSTFVINPCNQQLDTWRYVMEWLDMINPSHISEALIRHFFPKVEFILIHSTFLVC